MSAAEQTKADVLTRELWHVAGTGDVQRLEQILAQGVDVNASDRTGVTALMRAAYHGELPMVRALIEYGADLDAKDSGGLSALMMAKHSRRAEIADALMAAGAKENPKRRVHKSLPVDPEPGESAPLESAPGAVNNKTPVRTLQEPPEIWELVHTIEPASPSQTASANEFLSASRFPSLRTLILVTSILMFTGGAIFGFLSLWGAGSANDGTPGRHVSEKAKESKASAGSTTQPPTQTTQNATSAEPPKTASKSNQPAWLKPSGEVEGVRTTQLATPQSAQVAMPVKKSSAKAQSTSNSRIDVDMRVIRAGRYESVPKPAVRARGSNSDKATSSASVKGDAVKTPSPQVNAPKTTAPKPKVIQWP